MTKNGSLTDLCVCLCVLRGNEQTIEFEFARGIQRKRNYDEKRDTNHIHLNSSPLVHLLYTVNVVESLSLTSWRVDIRRGL